MDVIIPGSINGFFECRTSDLIKGERKMKVYLGELHIIRLLNGIILRPCRLKFEGDGAFSANKYYRDWIKLHDCTKCPFELRRICENAKIKNRWSRFFGSLCDYNVYKVENDSELMSQRDKAIAEINKMQKEISFFSVKDISGKPLSPRKNFPPVAVFINDNEFGHKQGELVDSSTWFSAYNLGDEKPGQSKSTNKMPKFRKYVNGDPITITNKDKAAVVAEAEEQLAAGDKVRLFKIFPKAKKTNGGTEVEIKLRDKNQKTRRPRYERIVNGFSELITDKSEKEIIVESQVLRMQGAKVELFRVMATKKYKVIIPPSKAEKAVKAKVELKKIKRIQGTRIFQIVHGNGKKELITNQYNLVVKKKFRKILEQDPDAKLFVKKREIFVQVFDV